MSARPVPVSSLTPSQLWEADIWVTEDAYIDVFTGRQMDPGELVRVSAEAEAPEPEIEAGL